MFSAHAFDNDWLKQHTSPAPQEFAIHFLFCTFFCKLCRLCALSV